MPVPLSDLPVPFSDFAGSIRTESAFDVLTVAKQLKAGGKDVVELEIGDSPFPSSPSAAAAVHAAIDAGHCRYGPSLGIPEFREAAAEYLSSEHGLPVTAENIVAGPGAKNFEQLFMEAFVDPGDAVLVFTPHFPTYPPNVARRGGRMVTSKLTQENDFRPNLDDVARFLDEDPSPKAIVLNSPHNPTGGVATESDLEGIANLIRGRNIALLSDEPYDCMVWRGRHASPAAIPGMLDQCVAAYTFSKSFSMSGWRLGFAASSETIVQMFGKLTNTSLSCVPPFTQIAGCEVLRNDRDERDRRMGELEQRVRQLVDDLNQVDGFEALMPGGTFYVFARVVDVCRRLNLTSHGLAMYLLQGADDQFGVACLGGECFGDAGSGYLRFSVAEPPARLRQAVQFLGTAILKLERAEAFAAAHPVHQLKGG